MADLAKLILDADTRGLKNAEKDLRDVSRSAQETAKKVGSSMASLGKGMTIGVTAPLTLFGKGAVQAAIDAQELQSMFDTTFGSMSEAMNKWAEDTGDAMGRSTQELQQSAAVFQGFFKDMLPENEAAEFSRTLTVLSQDVASFKNLANDDAQRRLFAAVTGEYESLKALGVVINDTVMKAKAMEMGFGNSTSSLTEQEKVLIRVALLQEKFADASGDVARTSDSAANEIKRSQAAFEELQVSIGTKLIPVLTPMLSMLGSALDWFARLPDPVQKTAVVIGGVAAATGPLLWALGSIITVAPKVGVALGAIFTSPWFLGAAAVIGAIYLAWKNWETVGPYFQPAIDQITAVAEGLGLLEGKAGRTQEELAKDAGWRTLGENILATSNWLQKLADDFDAYNARTAQAANDNGTTIQAGFRKMWEAFDQWWNGVKAGAAEIPGALSDMASKAVSSLKGFVSQFVDVGRFMVQGLVRGIKDAPGAVRDAIGGVMQGAIDWAKKKIDSHSPSRVFMEIGDYIGQGLAIGIERGQGAVSGATGKLTEAARAAAEETRQLVTRLFPEVERLMRYRADLATLDASNLPEDQMAEARRRLGREFSDRPLTGGDIPVSSWLTDSKPITIAMKDIGAGIDGLADRAKVKTVRIAKSFKEMADETLQSLSRLTSAIKGGGFLGILEAVVGLGLQLGSTGLFGKKIATNLNRVEARASGGPVTGGRPYLVGEEGPEVVVPRHNGNVISNDNLAMGGKLRIEVVANNGGFGAYVRNEAGQIVAAAAGPTASAGAAGALKVNAKSRKRSMS